MRHTLIALLLIITTALPAHAELVAKDLQVQASVRTHSSPTYGFYATITWRRPTSGLDITRAAVYRQRMGDTWRYMGTVEWPARTFRDMDARRGDWYSVIPSALGRSSIAMPVR